VRDSMTAFLFAQVLPEFFENCSGGAHGTASHILIEQMACGRHAVPEEQHRTDLPIELLGIGELLHQGSDIGLQALFRIDGQCGHLLLLV
jgi:hypothetical protein